ncbi:DUF485 domain-containing protein [Actinomadura litoris]|uniref:DUF485 domain-containing protein n=1 Tax=Actinomadura litoris TaxID=2678616 RepID=UPI001FA80303|nr:DUF485 domain-containing protein [Actinomadura litoris]
MVWGARPARRGPEREGVAGPGHYAHDARFVLLRRRYARLAAGVALGFLGWYFGYVALSGFARGLMARKVAGNVNVALLLGLLQFVSTFALAGLYVGYARRRLDPLAARLRADAAAAAAEQAREQR